MHVRRGRPENLRRREAILDAAIIRAGKNGYQGTTMADVAHDCGISSSLLFRYFPNKAALLGAMSKRSEGQLKWLMHGIAQAAHKNRTCVDFLVDFGSLYAEFIHRMHDYYALWFLNKDLLSRHTRWLFIHLYPTLSQRLADMPDYRNDVTPEVVTRAFLGAIFHVVFLHERMGTGTPLGLSLDEYVRTVSTSVGAFLATPKAETTPFPTRPLAA